MRRRSCESKDTYFINTITIIIIIIIILAHYSYE